MRAPAPKLIRRPSRSTPSVVLALLLLVAGGLGAWLAERRIVTGTWPDRTVTTLGTINSIVLGSVTVLVVVRVTTACILTMILTALRSGLPERVALLPDTAPGQIAVRRRDLATLVRDQVKQIGGVHSAVVTTRRSRVDVVVPSALGSLELVQKVVRKTADEALGVPRPAGITRNRVRIKYTS